VKNQRVLYRVLQELLKFPLLLAGSIFLLLTGTALTLTRPLLIAYLLNHYLIYPQYIKNAVLLMIGLLVVESTLNYFTSYAISKLGQNIIFNIRNKVYNHILRLSTANFDKTPVGTFITRCVSDVEAMNELFSQGLLQIGGDILMIVLMVVIMIYKNFYLSLSVLAVLPLLLIASSLFRKGVKKSFHQVRDAVAKLNIYIQERLSGMYLIKLFNVSEREMNTFKKLNAEHRDANIKTIFYYSVFFPVMDILTSVSFALLMYIGFELKDIGSVGLGDLTFFIMMAQMLFRPIRMLADRLNTLQMGIVSAGRVYDLLDDHQKVERSGNLNLPDSIQSITFRNVSFSYVSEHAVLKNIHFKLEKGKKLAVIGETGSGKSTIAQLLCGMYDGYDGEILLNNMELKNFNKNHLRKKIFIVLQDVFLFNDTLFENIRFYDPIISRQTVEQAVNDLQLNDFISGFPEGLDYVIKERGSGLSSGQKQLVAFLRAKLLDPDVFILDEATSFLDAQTEKQIQKAMNHILKNKTAIIIAHRLSTLMECDDVLALEKGCVVEYGKIQDVMKNENSVFRKYLDLQTESAV